MDITKYDIILYVTLATLTVILCLYVVISYLRNKEYRKPPAGLMFSKTVADLTFSLTFFTMLFVVDHDNNTTDNDTIRACNIYGPLFIAVFIASQAYFTAICWDFYRTLSNPFRKPAADSKKIHGFVWLFSCILVAIVAPFNVFRYRVQYGICFSCNTGTQFNYYNLLLFYTPMFITNGSGFLVTIFAFRRLSDGLEKTFELRQQIINRQLILVGLLMSLSILTVISWSVLIWAPTLPETSGCSHDATYMCLEADPACSDTSDSEKQRILLAILVFLNGFFDALAWVLLRKQMNQKRNNVTALLDISSGFTHTEVLIGHESIEDKEPQQEQVLCNALRGEIIAYMTEGLYESIHNTAQETYECMYVDDDLDLSLNDTQRSESFNPCIEDNDNGVNMNEIIDKLECGEPQPQRAQYPMHINDDPKTHRGVINEILINLPTHKVKSRMYKRYFTRNIVISSRCDIDEEDDHHNDVKTAVLDIHAEEEENESDHEANNGMAAMQTLYFEDAPSVNKGLSTSQSTVGGIIDSISRTLSRVVSRTYNNSSYNPLIDVDDDVVDKDIEKEKEKQKQIEKHKHCIPFNDYAPHVFRYLRQQIYNISDAEYLESVRPPDVEEQTKLVEEKFSEGRSGAFFFFTHDSKYMLKTITKQEATLLLNILPLFVKHFADNKDSLINRFFGLHSITMYNLRLYFVVLENVFVAGAIPHEIYDIKGSFIDRHTNHHVESGKLMKDQDLHKTLKLMPNIADNMYRQLKADSKFLTTHNIMDYSVLLGIYYVGIDPADVTNDRNAMANYVPPLLMQEDEEDKMEESIDTMMSQTSTEELFPDDLETLRDLPDIPQRHRPHAPSYHSGLQKYAQKEKAVRARVIEGPGIYYLGIIDVLQEWNTMKKLERLAKVYLQCKKKDGVSCVEPTFYRKRFLRKMWRIGIRPK